MEAIPANLNSILFLLSTVILAAETAPPTCHPVSLATLPIPARDVPHLNVATRLAAACQMYRDLVSATHMGKHLLEGGGTTHSLPNAAGTVCQLPRALGATALRGKHTPVTADPKPQPTKAAKEIGWLVTGSSVRTTTAGHSLIKPLEHPPGVLAVDQRGQLRLSPLPLLV
jgi:hypothetical protein